MCLLLVRHLDECFNLCVGFAAGLGAELYYIRDGVLNQYALKFNVPIPANVSDLNFTWRSLTTRPVSLSFAFLICGARSKFIHQILPRASSLISQSTKRAHSYILKAC
jgi:WIF domain